MIEVIAGWFSVALVLFGTALLVADFKGWIDYDDTDGGAS